MRSTAGALFLGLFLLGGLSACTRPESETEANRLLVWRMPGDLKSLDPARASWSRPQAVVRRTHEGLVVPDPATGEPRPGLAESWERSRDGLRYEFHLRPDVRFHDDRPVTAADVVYSLARHFDPGTRSSLVPFLHDVSGGPARLAGESTTVAGLSAPDDRTVVVTLDRPFAPLLAVLSMPQAAVIPEGSGPDDAVGAGPFRMGSWERERSLELLAYPDYWRGAPTLAGVRFLFVADLVTALAQFHAGEIDILDGLPSGGRVAFAESNPGQLRTTPGLSIYALGINHRRSPLGTSPTLRRAIAHAIDRDYICRVLNEGKDRPATQLLPPEMSGHDAARPGYPFDLDVTARLLRAEGYPGGEGLPALRLVFNNRDQVFRRIGERIQADLKTVGVELHLEALDSAIYAELFSGEASAMDSYDLHRLAWDADYPDPDALYVPLLHSSGIGRGGNATHSDPALDSLLDQASTATDPRRRAALYRSAANRVEETVALIPIYWKGDDLAVRPEVEGIVTGPLGESAIRLEEVRLVTP